MEVFRLSKDKYAYELSGYGASLYGGRWNSKGIEIVYTSGNRSLAMAEVLVHLSKNLIPDNYKIITIDIPDDLRINEIYEEILPINWNVFPPSIKTQIIGNEFISQNKYSVLKVPSAITKGDFNFLLNPYNIDFKKIKIINIENFSFDRRFF